MRHRSSDSDLGIRSRRVTSTGFVTGVSSAAPRTRRSGPPQPAAGVDGSFALDGKSARAFVLPSGLRQVWQSRRSDGSTQTRYQQEVGDASVFGGQVTVIRDRRGRATAVVGAYFPGLKPRNQVTVSKTEARGVVEDKIGTRGSFRNQLRLDPRTGRFFYQVQSLRDGQRPVRWVDASTGQVTKAFDALAEGTVWGSKGTARASTPPGTPPPAVRAEDRRRPAGDLRPAELHQVHGWRADDRHRRPVGPDDRWQRLAEPAGRGGRALLRRRGRRLLPRRVQPQQPRRRGHADRLQGALRERLLQRVLERRST